MYDEIIFSPDPRADQNDLIGVDDAKEEYYVLIFKRSSETHE